MGSRLKTTSGKLAPGLRLRCRMIHRSCSRTVGRATMDIREEWTQAQMHMRSNGAFGLARPGKKLWSWRREFPSRILLTIESSRRLVTVVVYCERRGGQGRLLSLEASRQTDRQRHNPPRAGREATVDAPRQDMIRQASSGMWR